MKIRLRHAEDEARRLGTERNRLARENAALHLRLERKIDALEHNLDPTSEQAPNRTTTTTTTVKTSYPTPISTNKTKNPNKTRPSDIITSLENLSPSLLTGALPTGGLKTGDWATKFDPHELLKRMKGAGSPFSPALAPMKTPFPPFKPFEPLTAEGRRRAAERLIDAPDHEKMLQEQRAEMAAYRAARYKFDEERSDAYALAYTRLRPTVNIPVQEAIIRRKIEETKERRLSEERSSSVSKPSSESSEGSLSSGEWRVSCALVCFVDSKRWFADFSNRGGSMLRLRRCREILDVSCLGIEVAVAVSSPPTWTITVISAHHTHITVISAHFTNPRYQKTTQP